jgi:hypothetical protein
MCWHGETYCLVGGYRVYGDAPMATPAKAKAEKPAPKKAPTATPTKAKAEKPAPRKAPKRRRPPTESDDDLGCSSPKIRHLNHGGRRLMTQQKHAG